MPDSIQLPTYFRTRFKFIRGLHIHITYHSVNTIKDSHCYHLMLAQIEKTLPDLHLENLLSLERDLIEKVRRHGFANANAENISQFERGNSQVLKLKENIKELKVVDVHEVFLDCLEMKLVSEIYTVNIKWERGAEDSRLN